MDRLGAGPPRSVDDPLLVEVALGGRARSDQVRLVGDGGVEGQAVGIRVDGHGPDPELAKGAKNPDRDLAAVGDQNLSERSHGRAYSVASMHFADQLTLTRVFSVPLVVVLFAWDFPNHYYWGTVVFALAMTTNYADGWWA